MDKAELLRLFADDPDVREAVRIAAKLLIATDPDVRAALREAVLDGGHLARAVMDTPFTAAELTDGTALGRQLTAHEAASAFPELIVEAAGIYRQSLSAEEMAGDSVVVDPRSPGVQAAVARGDAVPPWLTKLPHEKGPGKPA